MQPNDRAAVIVVGPLGFVPKRKEGRRHFFVNSRTSSLFSFLINNFAKVFKELSS
jgi:hypothetical protein